MKSQPVPPLAERIKPGLSATLPFPRELGTCQSCGLMADPTDGVALNRFVEFDEWDKPTRTIVVLCRPCEALIIEPHARIYSRRDANEPIPGAIPICLGCRFADRLSCTNPKAKANGGAGVLITIRKPTWVHLNYGGGRGGFKNLWHEPAKACRDKEPTE